MKIKTLMKAVCRGCGMITPKKAYIILFIVGFVAFNNAIMHPFVHDDVVFILKNPAINNVTDIVEPFTSNVFSDASQVNTNTYFRPFLEIIYRVEFALFKSNPAGYHAVNVLLHIINSMFVYSLVMTISASPGVALFLGLIFLVHPVQSEAVACISGNSNLLLAFFCLISFRAYLNFGSSDKKNSSLRFYYLISLVSFVAALLCKEKAIVVPFIVVLYELVYRCRLNLFLWRKRAIRIAGFFLVLCLYFIMRRILLGQVMVPLFHYKEELVLRLCSIPGTLLMYLRVLFLPYGLYYYRCVDILASNAADFLLLYIVLAVVYIIVRRLPETLRPHALFGIGWFVITLGPTLNVLPLIVEYSFILTAEHFLYLPIIGAMFFLTIVFIWGVNSTRRVNTHSLSRYVFIGVVAVCVILTFKQNRVWRSEVALFENTVKNERNVGRIRLLLAKAYYGQQRYAEAIREYSIAHRIMESYLDRVQDRGARQTYMKFLKEIYFDLAHCYEQVGDFYRALQLYAKVLRISPADSAIYNNVGSVYLKINNVIKAQENFKKALQYDPENLSALNNQALICISQKRYPEAEMILNKAIAIDDSFIPATKNLEQLLKDKNARQ